MTSESQDTGKDRNEFSGEASHGSGATANGSSASNADKAQAPSEIEKLSAECADLKDRLLRTIADAENQRKRAERERTEVAKFANEGILKDLVPVLDSFERAAPEGVTAADKAGNEESFREGFLMVKKQLLAVLKKHGLEPVESVGCPFDPNHHQAIQRIEDSEVKTETVHQEFAKGYTLNGRLVRAAMVSVKVPGTSTGS